MYFLTYDPRESNYPSNIPKDKNVVMWVQVKDSLKGQLTVVYSESEDFSFANLDKITHNFLLRYQVGTNTGDPGGKGNTTSTNPNPNSTSTQTGTNTNPNAQSNSSSGNYGNKGGNLGFGTGFGGLFNIKLPGNLPSWVWLIGAGFAGMKALDTDNTLGKVAYGGAAAFCTLNYLNNAGIPIKLPKIPFIGQLPAPTPKRLHIPR